LALTLLLWLFQTVPETLALVSLAVVLAGRNLELQSVLLIGLPHAAAVYLVRLLPIKFGIHFIVFIVILAVLLNVRLKIKFSQCLLTALAVLLFLAVAETLCMYVLSLVTGITIEQVTAETASHLIFAWPHILMLFLLALAVNRWRKGRLKNEGNHRA
jgi:hypothetical protein